MQSRQVLRDLNPNDGYLNTSSSLTLPGTSIDSNLLEKPRLAQNNVSNVTVLREKEEYLKVCKERDTLVDEVRKLTRELSKVKEPEMEQTSSWQQMTASGREIKRLEDEARDLKNELTMEKVFVCMCMCWGLII